MAEKKREGQNKGGSSGRGQAGNPHWGHRSRLRLRFLTEGMDGMEDHVKLELLLFYAIPYRDTNPIAHALLARFGSLANVFEAPLEELMQVNGLGESGAILLRMVPHLSRAYLSDKEKGGIRLYNTSAISTYLRQRYIGRRNEILTLIALDSMNRVLCCQTVCEGSIDAVPIHVRKIVSIALQYNAASVVLAHNHPSGDLMPSNGDIYATQRVYAALDAVGISLHDHFIIAGSHSVSMRDSGAMGELIAEWAAK